MSSRLLPVEIAREPDGVTLLCVSRRDVPLVRAEIYCPGGEWLEPPDLPGLATLTAALLEEGPAGVDRLNWHRELEREAIDVYADVKDEFWSAGCECLREDLHAAQSEWRSLMARPALPQSEWRRIVKQHRAAIRESWAQPANVIGRLSMVQSLGYLHPNAHFSFEKSFRRARYRSAAALGEAAYYRGAGVFGLIGGDLSVDEGFRVLRDGLAALPSRKPNLPPEPASNPSRQRVWLMDHPSIDQAYFVLARPGIRAGDPDRVALRLANYALGGGGFSSRLMARVRAEMGHTYSIHSSCPELRSAAPFTIQSFTRTGNLKAMLDLIARVLRETVNEGFTQEELEAARDYLHGSLPLQLTSPHAILRHTRRGLLAGLGPDQLEADWRALLATSREALHAAARRLIGDGIFHLAVIGPAKELRAQLPQDGGVAEFPFRTMPDRWPE